MAKSDMGNPMYGRNNQSAPGKVTPPNMYNPNQPINTTGGSIGAPTMNWGNAGMNPGIRGIGPSPGFVDPNRLIQLGNEQGQSNNSSGAIQPTEMLRRMMMGFRF